ncbi:MAG: POTRA domain-containing protein [Myxococcota bacterium]
MAAASIALLAAPLALAAPPTLAEVAIEGLLLDEADTLARGLELRPGAAWDDEARARVLARLERLGYAARLEEAPADRGVALRIAVEPYAVVRRVYIKGTSPLWDWFDPVFEIDVRRRVGFRPGSRLPLAADRAAAFEAERKRLREYLGRMGFFDADISIRVLPADRRDQVNLEYTLHKDRRFNLGEVGLVGNAGLASKEIRGLVRDQHHSWVRFVPYPFTVDRLKRAIDAVVAEYQARGYPAARVQHDFDPARSLDRKTRDANITLQIRERRHVEIAFEVDGEATDEDLSETLRGVLTIFASASSDDQELDASARELEHHYQRRGYFETRVRWERNRASRSGDRIVFRIERGPKLKVRAVQIAGNASFDQDELEDVVETRTFTFWSWLGISTGGYATTQQLQQDETRLAEFYRQRGFPDVHIRGEAATDWNALGRAGALSAVYGSGLHHGGALYVRFYVHEGARVRVRSVAFDEQTRFRTLLQPMIRHLALHPGAPFDAALLKADQTRLVRALSEAGYPYAEVLEPRIEQAKPDRAGVARVRIVHAVRWNAPARFGEIFVRGNFKTSPRVIREAIEVETGAPFDVAKLEETERKLRALGIFSTVRVGLVGLEEKSDQAHVLVQVEERYDDKGALEAGAGYSTDNQLFVAPKYAIRNFLGQALALELKGEIGMQIMSAAGTITVQQIPWTELRLDVVGFWRAEETERLGDITTVGFNLTLGRELYENLRGRLRYEFQQVELSEDLVRPAGPIDEPSTISLFPRTGMLGPGFTWDWRDSVFSPTCGWSVGGQAMYASPRLLGHAEFVRLSGNGQLLLPLSKDIEWVGRGCRGRPPRGPFRTRFTLAQGARYDQGFPLGGDVVLPEIERFFAGGDTTVRGFEEDRVATTLVEYELAPGVSAFRSDPQGGNVRAIHNLELWWVFWPQSPILGLPLLAASFLDTGLVTNSLEGVGVRDFRHGAGLALRLVAPFGALSFEYAWPLDPGRADDPTGRLHINFGAAFQF